MFLLTTSWCSRFEQGNLTHCDFLSVVCFTVVVMIYLEVSHNLYVLINSGEHSRGTETMSKQEGRGGYLNLAAKMLGAAVAVFGGLVIYYSYNTPLSVVDPRWVTPLGLFFIGIGGFMLLTRIS